MAKKRKTLPKDFEEQLMKGDIAALKAVFETCDVDARGGVFKQTALAFAECPDELARWLVEHGADLAAGDSYGDTPLHSRAGHWRQNIAILLELGADVNHGEGGRGTPLHDAIDSCKSDNVRLLLAHGARIDALNRDGDTPLEYGLRRCSNASIEEMAKVANTMIHAGASITPTMRESISRIGTTFEFHRSNFNPEYIDATSAALEQLYVLFDVPPVPRRAMHDGKAPIIMTATGWQDKHQELWELLVPSSGAAETVQGEAIRISGRIARELDGNGGINWDKPFRQMADAWLAHVGSGKALPASELHEAGDIIADVKRRGGDMQRLCELTVLWVAQNPKPVKLPTPSYDR